MSTINLSNLPSKFQPFLIGSSTCPVSKDEIDAIFQQSLQPLKSDYIFDAGKWVLKLGRTDGLATTDDTHLYRVRKAEKIRTYICQNNLEEHIVVSKKYLYWHESERKFYVVSEKMDLSAEVATPASKDIEAVFKAGQFSGQAGALTNNAPKRSLTPTQAKALAELSILGYTDLTYNNLYFTKDGKVAVIDTEPVKRFVKKLKSSCPSLEDMGCLLTAQSIAGIAKLKLYTNDPVALRAVQKVEKNHVLWRIAVLITKISVVTLAIYFTPTITALIPIAAVALTLKVSFIAVAVLKNCNLIGSVIGVYGLWSLSYQGFQGVDQIGEWETQGVF